MHSPRHDLRKQDLPALTRLRLLKPSPDDIREASARLGFDLAAPANLFAGSSPRTARLAPGEWLIDGGPSCATISARLAGILHHAGDFTAGKVGWILSGPRAADIITRDCTLDLHPTVFVPGAVTRTLCAQVQIVLERLDTTSFSIIADRSHEDYLEAWLSDSLEAG